MRILLQRYAYLGAYIAAPLLSLVVLWAFMQAENQRSYYYDIAGRLTEIQWRASQARENSMNALYLAQLKSETGKEVFIPELENNIAFLLTNVSDLAGLEYAPDILSVANIAALRKIVVMAESLPTQIDDDTDYSTLISNLLSISRGLIPITMDAITISHVTQKQSYLDAELFYYRFIALIGLTILSIFALIHVVRYKHAVSMTDITYRVTRLLSKLYLSSLDSERKNTQQNQSLKSSHYWLHQLADPKQIAETVPIEPLLAMIAVPRGKIHPKVIYRNEAAKDTLIPFVFFSLILEELVTVAAIALEENNAPDIQIYAELRRNWRLRRSLIIQIRANTSVSSLSEARTDNLKKRAGIGIAGSRTLLEAINATLKIEPLGSNYTAVSISYPKSRKKF